MRWLFLAGLLALGGCIGSAARDAKCQSFGAVPGTDAYVNCRATLEAARRKPSYCHMYGANMVCS